MVNSVLYVTYDGVLEPLGESQVVAYLERLASEVDITLISFEKPDDLADTARVTTMERRLAVLGITWLRLRYHKRPPALSSAFDAVSGIVRARSVCHNRGVSIIHARGYLPSLIALGARGASQAKFLFDMRGFWVDEKVEAGHWRAGGLLARVGRWWEHRFFKAADAIVSLTAAGVRTFPELGYHVSPSTPVAVIPTCVDLQRFTSAPKDSNLADTLGLSGAQVIGCIGTMSNWYMRREMLQYLAYLSQEQPGLRTLIVTREDRNALQRDAEVAGVPGDRLVIARASFDDMPRYLSLFDAGVFFIRPGLSKRGSAATKLAEFLAAGVPVIINDGVGDSGEIVRSAAVGLVLQGLNQESFAQSLPAVRALLTDSAMRKRCRLTAAELFDVDCGAMRYRQLYQHLSACN